MTDNVTMATITNTTTSSSGSGGLPSSTLSAELEHESTPSAFADPVPDMSDRGSGRGMDEGDDEVKDNTTTAAIATATHDAMPTLQQQEEQPQMVVLRHAMEGLTVRDPGPNSSMTGGGGMQDRPATGSHADHYGSRYQAPQYQQQQQYYNPYGMDDFMTGDIHFSTAETGKICACQCSGHTATCISALIYIYTCPSHVSLDRVPVRGFVP